MFVRAALRSSRREWTRWSWGLCLAGLCLAGLGLAGLGLAATALGQDALRVVDEPTKTWVKLGERPVMEYYHVPNPAKPYAAQLFSPAGVNVLRDSPADHKHHHGLMFAVAVDGVDFWSEDPDCGQQKHVGGEEPGVKTHGDVPVASGKQEIDWIGPKDAKLLMRETRTIGVASLAEGPVTVVGWLGRFEPPPGKDAITLGGSAYFGLGMRFVQSMDKGGKFLNADGKTAVAGTNDARSAWCAYSASAEGKPVTVAMFDFPGNPRHPATWFTMDQGFAYLSATLNLSKQPLKIEAGKPMDLRYAVAVWDGAVEKAKIDALYRRLVERMDRREK